MGRQKIVPQPPQYWFDVLLESVRQVNFQIAHQADARLRELGIEVSLCGMVPGVQPSVKDIGTDG